MSFRHRQHSPERVALGFASALLVLVSPLRYAWSTTLVPWWTPFLVWGALVALSAWAGARRPR